MAAEKLFAGAAGITFADLLAKAEAGEFVSRALGKPATIAVRVNKEEATGSNVAGILEGTDAKLKDQAIIYTAHYDAYGTDAAGHIFPARQTTRSASRRSSPSLKPSPNHPSARAVRSSSSR